MGGGWGLHSHFHVQPNYSVEVMLCCVVIGVVPIFSFFEKGKKFIAERTWKMTFLSSSN